MNPDKQLDPMGQKLRDFAYLVSHDLNAPLRAVGAFSEILMREYDTKLDDKGREYLTLIATQAKRAQMMLQGLLDYSRLNTMAKPITTRVEVARVFEHSTVVLEKEIEASGAVLTAGDLPIIQADAEQFMQLLIYLFDNAVKFAPAGEAPRIVFNGVDEGERWHFTVRDRGIGVEAAHREKTFVLFRQLHAQDTYSGHGMGLTLAQKIVERHGGEIWLDDDGQETGITVHFTIAKPR